jgi:hypothetical protein
MSGFVATSLVLLALGLFEGALGPRGDRLTSLLALIAVAPVVVHLLAGLDLRARRGLLAAALSIVGALLWSRWDGAAAYFLLSGTLALAALSQDEGERFKRDLGAALALTVLGYGTFVAVRDHVSLWPLLYTISGHLSGAAASLLRIEARIGPTYSGMLVVVAFAMAFAARAAIARMVPTGRTALAIVLLLVLPAAAVGARGLAMFAARLGVPAAFLTWRVLLFALLLVPLGLFLRDQPVDPAALRGISLRAGGGDRRGHRRPGSAGAIGVLILIVGGLLLLTWSGGVPARTGRVLLDGRGEFDLEPLVWGKYGSEAERGASLATLPPLLEERGFSVAVTDTAIDGRVLEEHDVLVIMNPAYAFEHAELEAIWSFVRDGGGLLVLGDHTNIHGTMEPLNTLLGPFGVRVAFDSAIPMIERWTWYGCMRVHPHPVTRGVRDETDVKISVGASLELPPHALPLLTGRDAFSDVGNWENEGGAYLGNMRRDAGETLGDIPLAAVVRYGEGNVIVFGDTSTFQRSAIYNTHELVSRVFTYLAGGAAGTAPPWVRWAGAIALAIGTIALMRGRPGLLPIVATASIMGGLVLGATQQYGGVAIPPVVGARPLAVVDLDHGNRVDRHTGAPNGIGGLTDHLWRGGYVPLGMKEFDADGVAEAALFVTVAPAVPFTPAERAALVRFVDRGGLLVVASGYEERRGAEGLLKDFGYAIGPTPIGAAHQSVVHLEGQSVFMHESWPVLAPEGRGEVWVSCWGYPLVRFEEIGRGGLIVIGDSKFLCDVKLESRDRFVEENINFLRAALEEARRRTAPGGAS